MIVTDARDVASAHAAASQEAVQQRWQQAEQQWYYLLTYGLLAAMVLVAIAVPNIWTALSAIGEWERKTGQVFGFCSMAALACILLVHAQLISMCSF